MGRLRTHADTTGAPLRSFTHMLAWLAPRLCGLCMSLFGPSFVVPWSLCYPLSLRNVDISTAIPMISIAIPGVIMYHKQGSRSKRFHLCPEQDIVTVLYGSPVHSAVLDCDSRATDRTALLVALLSVVVR
jgi:hypothetical protein